MNQNFTNSDLISFLNLIKGPSVQAQAVEKALEFICDSYFFCGAVVYELDYSSLLTVKEVYSKKDSIQDELPFVDRLTLKEQSEIAAKGYQYVNESNCSELEMSILSKYKAKSMIMTPVVEEESRICGFLVLLKDQDEEILSSNQRYELSVMVSMFNNYLGRRMIQTRFRQNKMILENILENAGIDIYVNDFYTHDILYVNESMALPYGGREAFKEKRCWEVLFPSQGGPCAFCPKLKLVDDQGNPTGVYIWDYQRALDGSWFRVFSAAFYWEDGRLAHVISSADITDNKKNETLIETLANYDQLTNLPNRRKLLKDCNEMIEKNQDDIYVLFFDIDGFKQINDTFGHDAGDEFLKQLSSFLSGIPMLENSIYRNGGDEFVALVSKGNIVKDDIRQLSKQINNRFSSSWKLKKGEVFCGVSMGVSCYREDGVSVETLLQVADNAMYNVKKTGGSNLCFGFELK